MNLSFLQRFRKAKPNEEIDLEAIVARHPNGLIVLQLNQPLQCIFMNADEATAMAKALLVEARRARIQSCIHLAN